MLQRDLSSPTPEADTAGECFSPGQTLLCPTKAISKWLHLVITARSASRDTAIRPKHLLLLCPILDFFCCEEMRSATQQLLGNIWEYSQTSLLPRLYVRFKDGLVIFKQIGTKETMLLPPFPNSTTYFLLYLSYICWHFIKGEQQPPHCCACTCSPVINWDKKNTRRKIYMYIYI